MCSTHYARLQDESHLATLLCDFELMCLWKPFCLNMVFWGSIQTFLSSLEPLIRCHFFVVVFNSTILKVDCEGLYYSQCINLLLCHIPHAVFTDFPFLVTFEIFLQPCDMASVHCYVTNKYSLAFVWQLVIFFFTYFEAALVKKK